MQYTFHLTNACNLSCAYCGLKKSPEFMSVETAHKALDIALSETGASVGIGFYGGEPLLGKELIYEMVAYVRKKNTAGKKIFFKLTTNGLLLDNAFLGYAKQENILISLSLDGNKQAHDKNRKNHAGQGSYDELLPIIPKLLEYNRYTTVMMTVSPNTVAYFYDSVKNIYSRGFINIICSLDYSAAWHESDLAELKRQYKKLAELYYQNTVAEKKFFFSPFESKINSHIRRNEYCAERCKLGYEQISVAADGTLYPCVQFVDKRNYQIGHVSTGIDQRRRQEIYEASRQEQPACKACALKERCLHNCSCLNMVCTNDINRPSPVLCTVEQLLIQIADDVAAKLYKKRNGMFIHKHYNELYPLVSLVEDAKKTQRSDFI
jgi:uncharacterized protein